jgi:hypothetical protein
MEAARVRSVEHELDVLVRETGELMVALGSMKITSETVEQARHVMVTSKKHTEKLRDVFLRGLRSIQEYLDQKGLLVEDDEEEQIAVLRAGVDAMLPYAQHFFAELDVLFDHALALFLHLQQEQLTGLFMYTVNNMQRTLTLRFEEFKTATDMHFRTADFRNYGPVSGRTPFSDDPDMEMFILTLCRWRYETECRQEELQLLLPDDVDDDGDDSGAEAEMPAGRVEDVTYDHRQAFYAWPPAGSSGNSREANAGFDSGDQDAVNNAFAALETGLLGWYQAITQFPIDVFSGNVFQALQAYFYLYQMKSAVRKLVGPPPLTLSVASSGHKNTLIAELRRYTQKIGENEIRNDGTGSRKAAADRNIISVIFALLVKIEEVGFSPWDLASVLEVALDLTVAFNVLGDGDFSHAWRFTRMNKLMLLGEYVWSRPPDWKKWLGSVTGRPTNAMESYKGAVGNDADLLVIKEKLGPYDSYDPTTGMRVHYDPKGEIYNPTAAFNKAARRVASSNLEPFLRTTIKSPAFALLNPGNIPTEGPDGVFTPFATRTAIENFGGPIGVLAMPLDPPGQTRGPWMRTLFTMGSIPMVTALLGTATVTGLLVRAGGDPFLAASLVPEAPAIMYSVFWSVAYVSCAQVCSRAIGAAITAIGPAFSEELRGQSGTQRPPPDSSSYFDRFFDQLQVGTGNVTRAVGLLIRGFFRKFFALFGPSNFGSRALAAVTDSDQTALMGNMVREHAGDIGPLKAEFGSFFRWLLSEYGRGVALPAALLVYKIIKESGSSIGTIWPTLFGSTPPPLGTGALPVDATDSDAVLIRKVVDIGWTYIKAPVLVAVGMPLVGCVGFSIGTFTFRAGIGQTWTNSVLFGTVTGSLSALGYWANPTLTAAVLAVILAGGVLGAVLRRPRAPKAATTPTTPPRERKRKSSEPPPPQNNPTGGTGVSKFAIPSGVVMLFSIAVCAAIFFRFMNSLSQPTISTSVGSAAPRFAQSARRATRLNIPKGHL